MVAQANAKLAKEKFAKAGSGAQPRTTPAAMLFPPPATRQTQTPRLVLRMRMLLAVLLITASSARLCLWPATTRAPPVLLAQLLVRIARLPRRR